MTSASSPNLVDWATLALAGLAAIGSGVAFFVKRKDDRERRRREHLFDPYRQLAGLLAHVLDAAIRCAIPIDKGEREEAVKQLRDAFGSFERQAQSDVSLLPKDFGLVALALRADVAILASAVNIAAPDEESEGIRNACMAVATRVHSLQASLRSDMGLGW